MLQRPRVQRVPVGGVVVRFFVAGIRIFGTRAPPGRCVAGVHADACLAGFGSGLWESANHAYGFLRLVCEVDHPDSVFCPTVPNVVPRHDRKRRTVVC